MKILVTGVAIAIALILLEGLIRIWGAIAYRKYPKEARRWHLGKLYVKPILTLCPFGCGKYLSPNDWGPHAESDHDELRLEMVVGSDQK